MSLTSRQQEIINMSIALIADMGIQKLTIKNISKKIGISEPAIYRHFKNKLEILMTLLDSFETIATDVLDSEKIKSLNPLDKIEFFLMDRYQCCADNPKLAKVMFAEGNFQDNKELSAKMLNIMHKHKEKIHRIIIRGQNEGQIRNDIDSLSLFRILFGPLRLLIKQWCLAGFRFDLEAEGKKLWKAQKKMIVC